MSVSFSHALAGQKHEKKQGHRETGKTHPRTAVHLIRHSGSPPNHPSIKGQRILELGWAGLGWPSLLPNHCGQKGSGLSQVSSAPEILSRRRKRYARCSTYLLGPGLPAVTVTYVSVLFLIAPKAPILISCMCHSYPAGAAAAAAAHEQPAYTVKSPIDTRVSSEGGHTVLDWIRDPRLQAKKETACGPHPLMNESSRPARMLRFWT